MTARTAGEHSWLGGQEVAALKRAEVTAITNERRNTQDGESKERALLLRWVLKHSKLYLWDDGDVYCGLVHLCRFKKVECVTTSYLEKSVRGKTTRPSRIRRTRCQNKPRIVKHRRKLVDLVV